MVYNIKNVGRWVLAFRPGSGDPGRKESLVMHTAAYYIGKDNLPFCEAMTSVYSIHRRSYGTPFTRFRRHSTRNATWELTGRSPGLISWVVNRMSYEGDRAWDVAQWRRFGNSILSELLADRGLRFQRKRNIDDPFHHHPDTRAITLNTR